MVHFMEDQTEPLEEVTPPDETPDEATDAPASSRRLLIVGAIAVGALLLAGVLVYRLRSAPPAEKLEEGEPEKVVSVKVATAERQPLAQEVAAPGTVFPREQATVAASIGAQIKEMRLLKNAVVKRGEVLAVLEAKDLQAQRAEAVAALQEAQLNQRALVTGTQPQANAQAEKDLHDARATAANARARYERRQDLYDKGGLALKDLEDTKLALTNAGEALKLAERNAALRVKAINPNDTALAAARITQAQERLKTLDTQLSFATLRAPLTGFVTDQFQFAGEYAAPGARLLTISDISEVIVKAQFADNVAAQLQTGDSVTVWPADAPDEHLGGKITLISRAADTQSRTVEIWVTLGNGAGRLRAGSAANVIVATKQEANAVVVPLAAVSFEAANADEGTVMVVEDDTAHAVKVKTGLKTPDKVQITEGLKGGESVIIEGNYALPDNTKVEVANGQSADEPPKEN